MRTQPANSPPRRGGREAQAPQRAASTREAQAPQRAASTREAQAPQRAASTEDRNLNRSPATRYAELTTPAFGHPSSARRGILLLVGATVWSLGIAAAPVFHIRWVYDFFAAICHQDPARSWHLFGEPLAVCIRCASVYFAFTASLWLGIRANVRWLRISLLLMLLEFGIARFLIDTAVLRSLSGILVGLAAAPFVKQGVEEIGDRL